MKDLKEILMESSNSNTKRIFLLLLWCLVLRLLYSIFS